MKSIQYQVSGLTCNGCVNRVKNALTDYAQTIEVTLDPPQATLVNPTVGLDKLNAELDKIGNYQLSQIKTTAAAPTQDAPKSWFATYKPLLLVFAYILMITSMVEIVHGEFALQRWMTNFMAAFFIVFSFFKMLDLAGFASSYAMYDLLAKHWKPYGYIYPFVELGLGLAYLSHWQPTMTYWVTFIVMSFSTIGVVQAVLNKQSIKCACLGTGFNLPMSTVTIIEDLMMVAMAVAMLVMHNAFLY